MKNKKIKGLAMVSVMAAMLVAASASAFAATTATVSGGNASSEAVLTTEAPKFSVTVPTQLPIHVDAEGNKTYADNAVITNLSTGAVKVTDLNIKGKNGYSVIDMDSDESVMKVNSKQFGLEVNGERTTKGDISFSQDNWGQIKAKGGTQKIKYSAIVSPTSEAVEGDNVADIIFTVGWDK